MTPAGSNRSRSHVAVASGDALYRAMGLAIIALFPALFWTGLLALVGDKMGEAPSATTLAAVGTTIAAFVFASVSALFARLS
jgi:hypothetical protein